MKSHSLIDFYGENDREKVIDRSASARCLGGANELSHFSSNSFLHAVSTAQVSIHLMAEQHFLLGATTNERVSFSINRLCSIDSAVELFCSSAADNR